MKNSRVLFRNPVFVVLCLTFFLLSSVLGEDNKSAEESAQLDQLPYLTPEQADENTPLSGNGFRTHVLGDEVTVPAWNRRSFRAWQIGLQINLPAPDDRLILPFGALFWWERPESNEHIFYGESVLVFNDIFFARRLEPSSSFEIVHTFNSYTIPVALDEVVDGQAINSEELLYGYVRPGIGVGYREQIGPYNENMFAFDLIVEPGYLYFHSGSDTSVNFIKPQDTFEIRTRMELRLDQLARNVLNMAHEGYATGANFTYGHRASWDNWGTNGQESSAGQNYINFNAYLVGGTKVPFVDSERHRLLGYLHAGIGHNLDRFSAERIGGGPNPKGDAYNEIWRPILPGASVWEYTPDNYAIAAAEYRWAATFFTYLSASGGLGTLNPLRQTATGTQRRQTLFPFLGAQVVTGFFGDTRLTLSYNHNWGVIRDGESGGNELMLWIAGQW